MRRLLEIGSSWRSVAIARLSYLLLEQKAICKSLAARGVAAALVAAVLLMLHPYSASAQTTIEVLWYTYHGPGTGYREAIQGLADDAHTFPEGSGLMWNLTFFGPGDAPDFSDFDVLVNQTWDFTGTDYSGLLDNRAGIEAARGTRTFISGQDADYHYIHFPGPDEWDGPRGFLVNAVNWAASGEGLGIVALDDTTDGWWLHEDSFLRDEFIGYVEFWVNTDNITIPPETAGFPVNAGLTSEGLSNWSTSAHSRIDKDLPDYLSINDYGPDPENWAITVVTAAYADDPTTPTPVIPPVGGEAYPISRLALLAPWIALAAIMGGAGLLVLRRRRA